jgi:hypothetical protein
MCVNGAEPIPMTMMRRPASINLAFVTSIPSAANTASLATRLATDKASIPIPRARFRTINARTTVRAVDRAEGKARAIL